MSNALGSALILLGVNLFAGTFAHFGFDRLLFGGILQGSVQTLYCRSIWIAFLLAAHLFFSILMSFDAAEETRKNRRNAFLFWAGTGIWFAWGLAFYRSTLQPLLGADAAAFFIFANAAAGALAQKHALGTLACWESFRANNAGAAASIEAVEDGLRNAAQAAAQKRRETVRG